MIDNGRSGNISKAEVILEALQKFNNKKTSAFFAEVFFYSIVNTVKIFSDTKNLISWSPKHIPYTLVGSSW